MSTLFLHILNISITAGWMILAVCLFRLIFRKIPRKYVCALWGLAGLRLLLPFSVKLPVSLIPSAETVPTELPLMEQPAVSTGFEAVDAFVNPRIHAQFAPTDAASVNPLQVVLYIAGILWAVGCIGMLVYLLVSALKVHRNVRFSVKESENVYLSGQIRTPFIFGIFKPRIYLPADSRVEDRSYALLHEQAHIRRKDPVWKLIGFLLLSVYWFQPLVWLGYMLFCRDIEIACDEKVLSDVSAEEKKDYLQALLNTSVPERRISACPVAFGEVSVKERIRRAAKIKKPGILVLVIACIAAAVIAVCFLSDPVGRMKKHDFTSIPVENGKLEFGMTEEEIIKLLGEPTERSEETTWKGVRCITLQYERLLDGTLIKTIFGEAARLKLQVYDVNLEDGSGKEKLMGLNFAEITLPNNEVKAVQEKLAEFYGSEPDVEVTPGLQPILELEGEGGITIRWTDFLLTFPDSQVENLNPKERRQYETVVNRYCEEYFGGPDALPKKVENEDQLLEVKLEEMQTSGAENSNITIYMSCGFAQFLK